MHQQIADLFNRNMGNRLTEDLARGMAANLVELFERELRAALDTQREAMTKKDD